MTEGTISYEIKGHMHHELYAWQVVRIDMAPTESGQLAEVSRAPVYEAVNEDSDAAKAAAVAWVERKCAKQGREYIIKEG